MLKFPLSAIFCLIINSCLVWSAPPSPYRSQGTYKSSTSCSNQNGTYPVSGSCDAYIECRNGVSEEKLCPDGLLYNEKSTGYPCSYPIDVECTKGNIQPAQPTDECPHQFGFYRIGDAKNCGQFKNCASGIAYIVDCPEGLAYNEKTYKCDWPDVVEECDAEAFLGFKCPGSGSSKSKSFKSSSKSFKSQTPDLGEEAIGYKYYPDPQDCQYFFICIAGRPRRIGCGSDRAFNSETGQCDDLENVKCSPGGKQKDTRVQYNKNKPSSPYRQTGPNRRF